MCFLQRRAERHDARINVSLPPGALVTPSKPLLYVDRPQCHAHRQGGAELRDAFVIAATRSFSDDPRFGLIAVSEIASRALSPGVNDPGTAIEIINRLVKVICEWHGSISNGEESVAFDRVLMPVLKVDDLFDDAFGAIARDGAALVEVGVNLQKAFLSFVELRDAAMTAATQRHSGLALERAGRKLELPHDFARARRHAAAVSEAAARRAEARAPVARKTRAFRPPDRLTSSSRRTLQLGIRSR